MFSIMGHGIVNAQSLSVKTVSLQPNDNTAVLSPCLDSNGDTCALIKIKTPNVEGLEFPNRAQYIKSAYTDGMYLIYMPTISRRLDFRHADYLPGQIDLGEYGYRRLKAGKTYVVQMEAPSNNKESILILRVSPASSRVSFDGTRIGLSSTGIYEFPLRKGTYSYNVSMDDYAPLDGSIQIDKDENKTIALDLKPIMHSVKVDCNVGDAHVFVDNVDYGEVGMLSLPQGNHHIRIQGGGYLDLEEDVNIQSNMKNLSYSLKKNKNVKEIHATPVRIFTTSSKVYKNNKEIGEWRKSGDVVMIMPGKYEISDKDDNKERVVVGTDSINVFLGNTRTSVNEVRKISSERTDGSNSSYSRQKLTRNPYTSYSNRTTNTTNRSYYTNRYNQRRRY